MSIVNGVEQSRHLATAIPGPKSAALHARKTAAVSAGIGVTLPVYIERAGGGILQDIDGNRLIDLGSGIAVTTVGNANPEVVAGVRAQVEAFTHTCFMVTPYEGYVQVCETLNRLTPGNHEKRSVLLNSGAEAVENAVKIARRHTGRDAVVVVEHGYHGRTNLTMGMTAKNAPYKDGFGPFTPELYRVPTSYPFRDRGLKGPEMAAIATTRIEKEIGAHNVAAIVIEPIQGEGGIRPLSDAFIRASREICTRTGTVLIHDEVQCGCGRTGKWFGYQHFGVTPDVITLAKSLCAGVAGGAMLTTVDLAKHLRPGMHASTFGGNPIAAAAGVATIRMIEEEGLLDHVDRAAEAFRKRLLALKDSCDVVSDVRVMGMMIGVELTIDGAAVVQACLDRNLLVNATQGRVIRLLPAMTISEAEVEEGCEKLAEAIREVAARGAA